MNLPFVRVLDSQFLCHNAKFLAMGYGHQERYGASVNMRSVDTTWSLTGIRFLNLMHCDFYLSVTFLYIWNKLVILLD